MQENMLYIIPFKSNDSTVQSNNKCQAIDNCRVKSCFTFSKQEALSVPIISTQFLDDRLQWPCSSISVLDCFCNILVLKNRNGQTPTNYENDKKNLRVQVTIIRYGITSSSMQEVYLTSEVKWLFNSDLEASLELTTYILRKHSCKLEDKKFNH